MNTIMLNGRLTADPELSETPAGTRFTRFNIACKSQRKDKDGNYITDFFRALAWRNTDEIIAKYLVKGDMLYVKGAMSNKRGKDKDGANFNFWELDVESVEFSNTKKGSESKPDFNSNGNSDIEDDLPF